jgi:hypothetical protein
MSNQKYHRSVGEGIPDSMQRSGEIYLDPTRHARNAKYDDDYTLEGESKLTIPNSIYVRPEDQFEAEHESGGLKICVRKSYDETRDIVYAILLDGEFNNRRERCTLKTVWINHTEDTHETLREEQYVT